MSGIYKSGNKVSQKKSEPTKIDWVKAFAHQLNLQLTRHAGLLQRLDSHSNIPEKLKPPIQEFFSKVIVITDQCFKDLKRLNKTQIQRLQKLRIDTALFQAAMTKEFEISKPKSRRCIVILDSLTRATNYFTMQVEMTHNSYVPGTRPNTAPVNWALRGHVWVHIESYQLKFGQDKYPHFGAVSQRAKAKGLELSERTYREIKKLHAKGTLGHYVQE